jgi:hypothetical protein
MTVPTPRAEYDDLHFSPNWYSIGCHLGCDQCSNEGINGYFGPEYFRCEVDGVAITDDRVEELQTGELPHDLRTYNQGNKSTKGDWTKFNPWRAPGAAPITDPCGIMSGYGAGKGMWPGEQYDKPMCETYPNKCPPGHAQGSSGLGLPPRVSTWVAGGTAEVGWRITVNHGGGYQYRLCPKSKVATEECFQAMPLSFATTSSVIHYTGSRYQQANISIPAKDISVGTTPAGSVWRRNPIPACNCDSGVNCQSDTAVSSNSDQTGRTLQDQGVYAYDVPMTGYCRGICGAKDGVNGRNQKGLDTAACQSACDALGDACIGYTFRERDGLCGLKGAGLDIDLPSGSNAYSTPTLDVAAASGQSEAMCILRSSYVQSRVLPQEEGVDYQCIPTATRGMTAELIADGQSTNSGTSRSSSSDAQTDAPTSGRGADQGEYVEYYLNTSAYEVSAEAPSRCPTGLQFPAPWAEGYGYYDEEVQSFDIIDTVAVPDSPGEYILSWRWDCEQSPQIWSNCADIIIAADPSAGPSTSPAAQGSHAIASIFTVIVAAFSRT